MSAEFQREVIRKLAVIETDCRHTRERLEAHHSELERLKAFHHRALGVVSVLSIAASAVLTYLLQFLRAKITGNPNT